MTRFISGFSLFRLRDSLLLEKILAESHVETFVKGTMIIQEGSSENSEGFVILKGTAEVCMGNEIIATLGKGDVFGEYAPIFQKNRTATIKAKENLVCLVLTKRSLLQLVTAGSGLNQIILKRVEENRRYGR